MSDIKLKPCPFCGSEAQIYGVDIYRVACTSDDCWCETTLHHCKEEAAEDWNMRAVPEPQRWIPVTERLPNERGLYIVAYHPCYWDNVYESTEVGIDTFLGKEKWAKRKYQRVTHWMPIPEPLKEEST